MNSRKIFVGSPVCQKSEIVEAFWGAQQTDPSFLLCYHKDRDHVWGEALPLQHFAWAKEKGRADQYKRYTVVGSAAVYGIQAQYDSILDTTASVKAWQTI